MYTGRDMTELTMISKNEWKEDELAYFHHSFHNYALSKCRGTNDL